MILPALLLTLDKYRSWRVGRVVPTIRSAVRTTLRSLLRSDLVAELNQTVIVVGVRRGSNPLLEGVLALFSWSDWSVGWFLEVIFCTFQLVRLRDQLAAN